MDQPLISMIIPIYNVEKYLRKCIESAINQTYKNLEILLIDDGSTDLSPIICDEYALKDNRISCFHIKNGGVSAARNYGINHSNGKFIVFVDGDDCIHCRMVEELFSAVSNGADFAMCSCRYIQGEQCESCKDISREKIVISRKELLDDLYYLKNPYPAAEITAVWGKIYVRKLIGEIRFDPFMSIGEDFLFNYYYMNKISQAVILKYQGYDYSINSNGAMHSTFNERKYQTFERIKEITVNEKNNLGFVTRMVNIAIVLLLMVDLKEQKSYFTEITDFIRQYRRRVLLNPKARLKVRASLALSYGGFENMIKMYHMAERIKKAGVNLIYMEHR